jgi:hypothetical protein
MDMDASLAVLLYLLPGLALSLLRFGQGMSPGDASFRGLFWPMEVMRGWIEILVALLLGPGREDLVRGRPPKDRLVCLPSCVRDGQ